MKWEAQKYTVRSMSQVYPPCCLFTVLNNICPFQFNSLFWAGRDELWMALARCFGIQRWTTQASSPHRLTRCASPFPILRCLDPIFAGQVIQPTVKSTPCHHIKTWITDSVLQWPGRTASMVPALQFCLAGDLEQHLEAVLSVTLCKTGYYCHLVSWGQECL